MLTSLKDLNKEFDRPYFGIKVSVGERLPYKLVKIVGSEKEPQLKVVDWFSTRDALYNHIRSILSYELDYRP